MGKREGRGNAQDGKTALPSENDMNDCFNKSYTLSSYFPHFLLIKSSSIPFEQKRYQLELTKRDSGIQKRRFSQCHSYPRSNMRDDKRKRNFKISFAFFTFYQNIEKM